MLEQPRKQGIDSLIDKKLGEKVFNYKKNMNSDQYGIRIYFGDDYDPITRIGIFQTKINWWDSVFIYER